MIRFHSIRNNSISHSTNGLGSNFYPGGHHRHRRIGYSNDSTGLQGEGDAGSNNQEQDCFKLNMN
ncbi:MAG: hypothetical protein PHH58_08640 [Rhodoferax sp.]|nr:hypothetical protein [Rhodoferax sp.]